MIHDYCIYGRKPVLEAIQSGRKIDKIMLLKTEQKGQLLEISSLARLKGIVVQFVPAEKIAFAIKKLTRNREVNHQGVLAFASLIETLNTEETLQKIEKIHAKPFLVVLDGVTDVGNFGAIARSAFCFGAHAIVMPSKGSAPVSPEAIKTSAGALQKIAVCREENLLTSVKIMKAHGIRIFAASEKANQSIDEINFNQPMAIVLGDEGEGISPAVLRQCDETFIIPMATDFDSLNVSVSAAISFYEAMKQRKTG